MWRPVEKPLPCGRDSVKANLVADLRRGSFATLSRRRRCNPVCAIVKACPRSAGSSGSSSRCTSAITRTPHFHARYGGKRAVVQIRTLKAMSDLSPRVLGFVVEWARLHQQELLEKPLPVPRNRRSPFRSQPRRRPRVHRAPGRASGPGERGNCPGRPLPSPGIRIGAPGSGGPWKASPLLP
jgi:uncharacterized protein DUF4160